MWRTMAALPVAMSADAPARLADFTEKRLDDVLGFWREHRNGFELEETMPVLGPLLDDRWVLYEELPKWRVQGG